MSRNHLLCPRRLRPRAMKQFLPRSLFHQPHLIRMKRLLLTRKTPLFLTARTRRERASAGMLNEAAEDLELVYLVRGLLPVATRCPANRFSKEGATVETKALSSTATNKVNAR